MSPSPPYRILFLLPSLQIGGAERAVLLLMQHLDRDQFTPELCCTLRGGPLVAEARTLGIPIHFLNARHMLEWGGLMRLRRLLRRQPYDLMHSHMMEADVFGRLGAMLAGRIPFITTVHNSYDWQERRTYREWIQDRLERWTYRTAHQAICVSDAVRTYYEETVRYPLPRACETIPNPFEPAVAAPDFQAARAAVRAHLGLDAETCVVLTVATLTEKKDHATLLEAWARLQAAIARPTVLLLAGDGPLREALTAQAAQVGIEKTVQFLGERNDVPRLWAAADLGVWSSIREGLPLAVIEAGAAGRAVVATAVGGVPEVVRPGGTGVLVPARDPIALATALQQLIEDEAGRTALGTAAARWVHDTFHPSRIARRHEEVYLRVISRAS